MSVSARKKIFKTFEGKRWSTSEGRETFNCWNDEGLNQYFKFRADGVCDQTNMDGCGTLSIGIATIKEAIDLAEKGELQVEESTLACLKRDYDEAIVDGDDFIDYECY